MTFFISMCAVSDILNIAEPSFVFYFTIKIFFVDNLKNGKFHQHLRDIFAPQVF